MGGMTDTAGMTEAERKERNWEGFLETMAIAGRMEKEARDREKAEERAMRYEAMREGTRQAVREFLEAEWHE